MGLIYESHTPKTEGKLTAEASSTSQYAIQKG